MENRFLSFALDEERSTYTEGESKSRRSSILKPPKARAPLQEVNLGGSADDTEDFDTLRKRRVSFAGVNSVKEFCSQAESLQVCHIQSYEETFSTSSDNSQNNSAKSLLQLGTPKNAVPSGEDHNFADDPMDLTDSVIDDNRVANKSAPLPVIQVIPVFTPCDQLTESGMDNRASLPSWGSQQSLAQRPVIDGNMTSSNMSITSVVGAPLGTPRNPGAPVGVSSPWSCSMEMTEPVHVQRNRMSSVYMPNQDKIPILPFRNSFKVADQSDHGMELTEAVPVKIRPFSINQANENSGDMSMEMTEMVKRAELQSFRSLSSYKNKSASMEFTEVVHTERKSSQFHNFHLSGIESSLGENSEHLPPTKQISSNQLHSAPPEFYHVTPFPNSAGNPERGSEKSLLETTANHSLCDMEMTGVLSLSKCNKMVSNYYDADDMDFTQMLTVNGAKKARMSNEPDEEPFQIISPVSTKVCDVQHSSDQNKPQTSRHSIPASLAQDKLTNLAEPLASNVDLPVISANQFDDDDTFALNFKNIKRGDDPIELSFLKEFRESPKSNKPVTKVTTGHDFTLTQNSNLLNHEHFLLYSPPKYSKSDSDMKKETGLGRVSSRIEPLSTENHASDLHQTKASNFNTQKVCSGNSFEAQVFKEQQNIETDDPLRNVRNSRSFAGEVSVASRVRVSFKDFEIKPDSIVANEGLSIVGLDDSGILKAGLNDMTCPERVPSVCMSTSSYITSPCSKSRTSFADRTTVLSSPTQDVHQKGKQKTLVESSQPAFGSIAAREDQLEGQSETPDDQDTSVSMPFVFKPVPEKNKSDSHKLGLSFPIIDFDESPNRCGVFLPQQRTSVGINHIAAANKSVDPNQFVPDQEGNNQGNSISMPFVFKAATEKISSDAYKLRQSFPVIECGESLSSAQMEFTEVTPTVDIESRKSLVRINSNLDGHLIQPSHSSGQMELTDVGAVNRKSTCSSNMTACPWDSSGIEMDEETLLKMEAPPEVVVNATGITEGLTTTSCDMEETNVKQKNDENPRKSFPLDYSPLSLTSEETITRPNSSNVACTEQPIGKRLAGIHDEDTLAKSSHINVDVTGKEHTSSSAIDMERTAVNPQIRLSLAPNSRKSLFSLISPDKGTTEEIINTNDDVHTELDEPTGDYSHDQRSNFEQKLPESAAIETTSGKHQTTELEQVLNVGLDDPDGLKSFNVKRRSDFFTDVDKSFDVFPPARLSCRKSDFHIATDAKPDDDSQVEQAIEQKSTGAVGILSGDTNFTVQNHDVLTSKSTGVDAPPNLMVEYRGELKSFNENRSSGFFSSAARISCRESGFGGADEALPEDYGALMNESTEVGIPPNVKVDYQVELKSQDASPPARPACRKSGFEFLVGSQPEVKFCDATRSRGFFSSAARISCRKSGFGEATEAQPEDYGALMNESTQVGIPPNVKVDLQGVLKSPTYVSQDASPPAQPACRKSGFGFLVGSQPEDGVCDEEGNNGKISPGNTAMELTSVDALIGKDAVDEKPESDPTPPVAVLETEGFQEHDDRGDSKTDIRLPRKSVRFVDSPRKEDNDPKCYRMVVSPEKKLEEVDAASGWIPFNGCTEVNLNACKPEENGHRLPRRMSRKSCIGLTIDTNTDIEGECNQNPISNEYSGEFEFAIRRTKRKSTIGIRQSENYPEFDQRAPEDYDKMNITPLDGQLYESEQGIAPASESAVTDSREAAKDIDLSQDMMNISLNDGELDEVETGQLNATSTPCKPRVSCTETKDPSWDRKRNRSGTAKTSSLASDLAHDLSQDMMNISIQSDTRSPLPKKSSIEPIRKSIERPLKGRGLNLHGGGFCKFSFGGFKVSENLEGLEYESRIANRELMKSLGFNLLGSQTCWEFLLYDRVLGIKVVLPLKKFSELTRIISIDYTFYSWRIGRTTFLDRETVEFIRNRLHRNMPKEWLREECSKIGDLFKIVSSLKREIELLKPLINQLHYLKSRRPCTISNDRISFKVVNLHLLVNCEIILDLKNSHKMSDCVITVRNINGKLNLDTVRLVFHALSSSDVNVLYRFVKCLDSETSQFLARE